MMEWLCVLITLRSTLPFDRLPTCLVINLVMTVVKMLTFFPTKAGVSTTMSPRAIMTGEKLHFKKHLTLHFGSYCQVHEEENPTNSDKPRTRGAISMGPSGNKQGGYRSMALNSGLMITRRNWDMIPMPDIVITQVNLLGKGQPERLTFRDHKGRIIGDTKLT